MNSQQGARSGKGGIRVATVAVMLLGMVTAMVVVGCVTPPIAMDTPEGFAVFSDTDVVRAISPEGVLVRARTVPNDPAQSLEFWAEALERQLTESGYLLVEKSNFTIDAGEGVLMEWLAPVSEDDWIYLTAISIVDSQITVVEAAGPTDHYDTYRTAIRKSLESLRIKIPES
ncbi:MAG: hypothetical protein KAU31_07130 [Spirochaetaceae bacterium]|nr:hypothetical protein [Spirochaetaceae bacterium]